MTDQVNDRTFKPLYLKDSDEQCCDNNRVTDLMPMERVTEVIGNRVRRPPFWFYILRRYRASAKRFKDALNESNGKRNIPQCFCSPTERRAEEKRGHNKREES